MTNKRCTRCGETKALSEFSKRKTSKDGLEWQCKACKSACAHKYHIANQENIKVRKARWYAANKEKARIAKAKYRAANADKVKTQRAKYRADNRDRRTAAQAEYRAENPKIELAIRYRRRVRELGADGTATAGQIADRWAMWGDACYICGKPAEATDHVIPLAAGGSNWPANLRPICNLCNSRKHAQWPYDFAAARMNTEMCR